MEENGRKEPKSGEIKQNRGIFGIIEKWMGRELAPSFSANSKAGDW